MSELSEVKVGGSAALAYGIHIVGGVRLRHKREVVGNEVQTTVAQGLGTGEWDGPNLVTYEGVQIDAANYHFHAGTLATDTLPATGPDVSGVWTQGVDPWFPDGITYNRLAHNIVRLPVGMASDGDPDKLKGVYRTKRVNDYDAVGAVVGYGFSVSPIRQMLDLILVQAQIPSIRIHWPSWYGGKVWTAVLVGGEPRFQSHAAFLGRVALIDALNTILYQCACTIQDDGEFLRLLTPEDRPVVQVLTPANTTPDTFEFYQVDQRERVNKLSGEWRDVTSAELKKMPTPIVVKRDALIASSKRTLEGGPVNLGPTTKNQGARTLNYRMRFDTDAPVHMSIQAFGETAHVFPGDRLQLEHESPEWVSADFEVLEVFEDDGTPDLRTYVGKEYVDGRYSDADTAPIQSALAVVNPSRFASPPLITSLTLSQSARLKVDGTYDATVDGVVQFAPHVYDQVARVWIKRAADVDYAPVQSLLLFPERTTNRATFSIPVTEFTTYNVKIVTYSPLGQSQPLALAVAVNITVDAPVVTAMKMAETMIVRDGDKGLGFLISGAASSLAGFHFGFTVWRSRQGEPYRKVADVDQAGVFGECLTVLNTNGVGNAAANTFNDGTSAGVVVNLSPGMAARLQDATSGEVEGGANRAVAGFELIGWTTFAAAPSYGADAYLFTGLYRGQAATEYAMDLHTLNEPFILLDDAVRFIAAEEADIGAAVSFKAVTKGLDVAGTGAQAITLGGTSLKPRGMIEPYAILDASGDWMIRGVSRARLEERPADHMVDVYSGVTFKRSLKMVREVVKLAAIISDSVNATVTKNKIAYTAGSGLVGYARTAQEVTESGAYFECIVHKGIYVRIGFMVSSDSGWNTPLNTADYDIHILQSSDPTLANIYEQRTFVAAVSQTTPNTKDVYVRVTFVGTVARFYIGDGAPALEVNYVGRKQIVYPLRVRVVVNGMDAAGTLPSEVREFYIGGLVDPHTIYSLKEQQDDNGGVGLTSITTEMYQLSPHALIGHGQRIRTTF